jgi:hypothetical protein
MPRENHTLPSSGSIPEQGRKPSSSCTWAGGQCVCPKCSYRAARVAGQACNQRICPKCGAQMAAALLMS